MSHRNPNVEVTSLGHDTPPIAKASELPGQRFNRMDDRRWITVEGRVGFVARTGNEVRFDLETDRHIIAVTLADAAGLDLTTLLNSRGPIAGIGRGIWVANQSLILGKLFRQARQT